MKILYIILISSLFPLSEGVSAYEIMSSINDKEKPIDIKATFTMESVREKNKRTTQFIS